MLHLWKGLAPEMKWKFVCSATECCNEVVFPRRNEFFGKVAVMVIWWDKLVGYVCVDDSIM